MAAPKHVYELYIRTTPAKLWAALTDGEISKKYFYGTAVKSTWKAGAPFSYLDDKGAAAVEGQVLECEPQKKLVLTWNARHAPEAKDDRASRVTFAIESLGGAVCKLTVLHDDFDGETFTYKMVGSGWNPILSGLKTLLETGEPLVLSM